MSFSNDRRKPRTGSGRVRPLAATMTAVALFASAPAMADDGDRGQGKAAQTEADGENHPQKGEPGDMTVSQAWQNAKEDWRALQEASGDAWEDARRQFEESWADLQSAMRRSDDDTPPPPNPAPEQQTE